LEEVGEGVCDGEALADALGVGVPKEAQAGSAPTQSHACGQESAPQRWLHALEAPTTRARAPLAASARRTLAEQE
jgi:hypothetical protein